MKAICKEEVIDLMRMLSKDGVDNSHYNVDMFVTEKDAGKFYGADGVETLKPGAYCAIWFDEEDFSDFPSVDKWINTKLNEENIAILDNGTGWIIVICLDLLLVA